MNLRNRIGKLESRHAPSANYGEGLTPREWERHFHILENAQRELKGLEPLPDLEYTQEDYESDLRFLNETIPHYRCSSGWQSESAKEMLTTWEEHTKSKMARHQA